MNILFIRESRFRNKVFIEESKMSLIRTISLVLIQHFVHA